jgi:hypothetical protein
MIDASKSPLPTWKRYGLFVLLAVLIVVAGYVIWTKELHKSSSSSPATSPPAATTPAPATAKAATTPSVATTVPGGLPISSRNPFGG